MADTHDCPGGCGAQVPRHHLACPQDWKRLPLPLQRELNFWYRRRTTHARQYQDARAKCLDWYRTNPREVG